MSPRNWLFDFQELVNRKPDIFGDLADNERRNISALVERHRGNTPIRMAKLPVGTALPDLSESERGEAGYYFLWLEHREVAHELAHNHVVDSHKLRLDLRLTVLKEHPDNLAKVAV